ncbi:MAG TPA: sulfurtransferase [Tepidiformaceae bacterium]|jgi:thiosulfate/3-mercaptopyruvate sulfurtransferase
MTGRLKLLIAVIAGLATLASACGGAAKGSSSTTEAGQPAALGAATATDPNAYGRPELLAETTWLNGQLNDKSLVIVDLRKKDAYDAGHIPGAVWYDSTKLKDPDNANYVIKDTQFAPLVGDIGIDNSKTVVAYDDNAGLSSTRFWWVLWYYGDQNGKVLNGGFPKWQKENLPTSKDAPTVQKAVFKPVADANAIASMDAVKQKSAAKDPNVVILDVRTTAEYTGADVRSAKGGHVPTAINVDYQLSLAGSDIKVWKSAADLRKQFEQAGVKPGAQVITYCQSGVRAAHSFFTLMLLGYKSVSNYDGSWAEWGNNKDTPIAQ